MPDAARNAPRFKPDRHHPSPPQLRDQHQGVAPGDATERTELVAANEHETTGDASLSQPRRRPPSRVGLVGEADLDMLDVTGDPGALEARGVSGSGRHRD